MIIIILATILIIAIILIVESFKYNRFEELIIRINEAEANIDAILNKEFDLLNKSISIIKSNIETNKDVLEDIIKLRSRKLNNFDLDKQLNESYKEFKYYVNNFENLKNNESFTKIEIDLIEVEANIIALKEYYNDNTSKFNLLIHKFPSNIIAKFKKYKEKQLFELEKNIKNDDLEVVFEDEEKSETLENN